MSNIQCNHCASRLHIYQDQESPTFILRIGGGRGRKRDLKHPFVRDFQQWCNTEWRTRYLPYLRKTDGNWIRDPASKEEVALAHYVKTCVHSLAFRVNNNLMWWVGGGDIVVVVFAFESRELLVTLIIVRQRRRRRKEVVGNWR